MCKICAVELCLCNVVLLVYWSNVRNCLYRYVIDFHVKAAHFDCPWEPIEDSHLLWGVYEYGMGNWEAIKMDPDFDLHDKVNDIM